MSVKTKVISEKKASIYTVSFREGAEADFVIRAGTAGYEEEMCLCVMSHHENIVCATFPSDEEQVWFCFFFENITVGRVMTGLE